MSRPWRLNCERFGRRVGESGLRVEKPDAGVRTVVGRITGTLALGALAAMAAVTPAAGAVAATGNDAAAASGCPDVELVFARGTGEPVGLGSVGIPLAADLAAAIPGRTLRARAVDYPALVWQTTAVAGAVDLVDRVEAVARACSDTTFVVGGYSQGSLVVDVAIGVLRMGGGTPPTISLDLAHRIAAVVVFGNPLGLTGKTISGSSEIYGSKTMEFCNAGDPVCGAGFNVIAHTRYSTDGSTRIAARFVAQRVNV
jgi:cutinase